MESSVSESSPLAAEGAQADAATARPSRRRRVLRRLGTALVVLGVLSLLYGAAVYFWHDPVTDLWARWQQRGLESQLEQSFADFQVEPLPPLATIPATPEPATPGTTESAAPATAEPEPIVVEAAAAVLAPDAKRFKATLASGDPVGRLVVGALGIRPVVVNGTEYWRDLSRGPGLYAESTGSRLPGLGRVTAIAGHRTTFGAWFRHIDRLKAGDQISLALPYGTFRYRVVGHEIVDNGDWSILDPRSYEMLVLSACHPLYSASQRWVVFARLVSVDRPDGTAIAIAK
jgi:sortase A